MLKDKKDIIILSLVCVVVVLSVLVIYFFAVQPALNGLVIKGYNLAVNDIITQVKQTGYVAIPLEDNSTMYLIQYNENSSSIY